MRGVIWVAAIGAVFFLVSSRFRRRSPVVNDWFGREQLALVVALLGTFSIVSNSDTEEVLRDPVTIERIVRGGLAVTALLIVAPILLHRIRSYTPGRRAMAGLLAYVGVALVSTIYSAAPLVTAAKVLELTAGLAPVLAIAMGPKPRERLRSTVTLSIGLVSTMLAVGVVGFVVLPSFKSFGTRPGFVMQETMVTPFASGNALAALGATIAIFAVAKMVTTRTGRRLWIGAAVVGTSSVVLTAGRQGVVILILGLALVLWSARRNLLIGLVVPAVAWVVYEYGGTLFDIFARDREYQLVTLSGRVGWWEIALETWSDHPWTGWGYGAGGRFVALASIGRSVGSVHSGYVEALVGVGIVGVVGLVYALVEVVVWSVRTLRAETAVATLIVPLALRTGVSSGFGGWLSVEFVLFALLVAIVDQSRIDRRHPPHRSESSDNVGYGESLTSARSMASARRSSRRLAPNRWEISSCQKATAASVRTRSSRTGSPTAFAAAK
jgi:O-antigen ligase